MVIRASASETGALVTFRASTISSQFTVWSRSVYGAFAKRHSWSASIVKSRAVNAAKRDVYLSTKPNPKKAKQL